LFDLGGWWCLLEVLVLAPAAGSHGHGDETGWGGGWQKALLLVGSLSNTSRCDCVVWSAFVSIWRFVPSLYVLAAPAELLVGLLCFFSMRLHM
jgi:hypothetical protein